MHWSTATGNQRSVIPFTENPGLPLRMRAVMANKTSADFFALLVPEEIFQYIADCTNQFAIDIIISTTNASRYARLRKWFLTNLEEINQFIGLEIFMGIVKLPKIADLLVKRRNFESVISTHGNVSQSL